MKHLILIGLLTLTSSVFGFDQTHSQLTGILRTYVNGEGMVDYAGLLKNREPLDSYLKTTGAVSQEEFSSWDKNTRLAFLINVYNAETLQLIIDHSPVPSIKKIGSIFSTPWKVKSVQLFGETTTLDHVEHGILRAEYAEPRIHFALVCAALSCPPLRTEAFVAEKLDDQLNDQARIFLNQKTKNRIEGDTLYLSAIFNWFEEDFTSGGKSLNEYVAPYIGGDTGGKMVKFTDYDWSLNKQ